MAGINMLKEQNALNREDWAPWRETGLQALDAMNEGIKSGGFTVDLPSLPSYKAPSAPDLPEFRAPDRPDLPTFTAPDRPDLPDFKASDEAKLPTWGGFTGDDLKMDPGYQFRLEEGLRTIRRRGAAGHYTPGGATEKALQRYRQDYASGEFGKARARAVEDYGLSYRRATDMYGRELGEHELAIRKLMDAYNMDYQAAKDMYEASYRKSTDQYSMDYQAAVDTHRAGYGRAMDLYGINRQNRLDEYNTGFNREITMYGARRNNAMDRWNRLTQIANYGAQATGSTTAQGQANVGAQAGMTAQAGQVQGAGEVGAANAMVQGDLYAMQADQMQWGKWMDIFGTAAGFATAAG